MSATFRLAAKKKVSQDDLRKLMAVQKGKVPKQISKINNPLAKYNEAGQLTCVLCKSIVRSENVWQVHVNAKQHKQNVEEAKKLKELTNNFTTAVKVKKRPGTPPPSMQPEKKMKGILKNAPALKNSVVSAIPETPNNNAPNIISHHDEEIKRVNLDVTALNNTGVTVATVDNDPKKNEESIMNDQPIPEGFFDDPILDAKARNIEYKDPIEEEWDKFQKEIREEASASAEIIAGEQEEATAERQIDEIDEQIRNWSRVLDLEVKKEEAQKKKHENENMAVDDDGDTTDNETDIDEFLDWRAKKSFR